MSLSLLTILAAGFQIAAAQQPSVYPPNWTYLSFATEGDVVYFTFPLGLPEVVGTDISLYITTLQAYGVESFYATTMYDGTPATLPGPLSIICQWQSGVFGSSASVLISTSPNMSNSGGCLDLSMWPSPLNITVAALVAPGEFQIPLHGSVAAFGLTVQTPSSYSSRHLTSLYNTIMPSPVVDRQMIDAFSVANFQPSGGTLALLMARFAYSNGWDDSILLLVAPQLSDGDYAVFVMMDDEIGAGAEPICKPASEWPAPNEPVCTPWMWSFTTSNGAGTLFIDGADPCNATRMRTTAGGPPPVVNTVLCSLFAYHALNMLWVAMVPLPTPATALIPAAPGARAGSQQVIPQVRAIPSSPATAGQPWSLPLLLADGAPIHAVTVPYTMCPARGPGGSCIGDDSSWRVASAALYFMATGDGLNYPDIINDHVDIVISRLCVSEALGLGPVANATVLSPRPGVCGPPLTIYLQVTPMAFYAFYQQQRMPRPDAFAYNITLDMRADESSVHLTLPPTLCNGNNAYETCAYVIAVVANCTSTSPLSPVLPGDCPQSGIDDGSVRALHQVAYTSTRGIRTLGPDCLAYGAPCVVQTSAGILTGSSFRFALPTVTNALPPLLVWIQLSSAADGDMFLCQEPLGGPGSQCVTFAMPPYQPRGATSGFDATASVRGGTASALLALTVSDLTRSGRPYFRAFVSMNASPATLPFAPNISLSGRSMGIPRAAGVPFSLVIAAGPTLIFVPPQAGPPSAVVIAAARTSAALTLQPCAFGLSTDPSFPAPSQAAFGYTIEVFALLPQWFDASTDPSGLAGAAPIVLSTAVGVRLALDRASQFGQPPAAFVPASATMTGGPVSMTLTGLVACTTYRVGVVARCSPGSGTGSGGVVVGCLPYLGESQDVAYPTPFNFTTSCAPPPPGPTPSSPGRHFGSLSVAELAGVAAGTAVVLIALVVGVTVWCRRSKRQADAVSKAASDDYAPLYGVGSLQ